jgi:hypothetical protein
VRPFAIAAVLSCALAGAASADRGRYYYAPPFTPQWAAPQLDVRPEVGPPGTRVQITGVRFHDNVRLFYGNQPMPILELGRRHAIAVIPPNARGDDFIYVVDSTGRARSFVPFDVTRRPYRHRY